MKDSLKYMLGKIIITDDIYECNLCDQVFTDNDLIKTQIKRHVDHHTYTQGSASKNNIIGVCKFIRLIRCDGCEQYIEECYINTENDPLCEECYNQQGIDRAESIQDLD